MSKRFRINKYSGGKEGVMEPSEEEKRAKKRRHSYQSPAFLVQDRKELQQSFRNFKKASKKQLQRLIHTEGFTVQEAVDLLVEKLRGEHVTEKFVASEQEVEIVLEASPPNFDQTDAFRTLMVREELIKLKDKGLEDHQAVDELAHRMKTLIGSKRKTNNISSTNTLAISLNLPPLSITSNFNSNFATTNTSNVACMDKHQQHSLDEQVSPLDHLQRSFINSTSTSSNQSNPYISSNCFSSELEDSKEESSEGSEWDSASYSESEDFLDNSNSLTLTRSPKRRRQECQCTTHAHTEIENGCCQDQEDPENSQSNSISTHSTVSINPATAHSSSNLTNGTGLANITNAAISNSITDTNSLSMRKKRTLTGTYEISTSKRTKQKS